MAMSKPCLVLLSILLFGAVSCKNQGSGLLSEAPTESSAARETVLKTGQKLVAETKSGPFAIEAGTGFVRSYEWDSGKCKRSVELWPRSERWYGSYGIYFPGPGDHWKNCGGVSRGVLEEGQMHFESDAEAKAWLEETQKPCLANGPLGCEVVVGNDGLVLELAKVPNRRQLNASLFQVYVKGSLAHLPGESARLKISP